MNSRSVPAEFHGLEEWMLLRSLQALQTEGKAEIITMDDGKGVKFFWLKKQNKTVLEITHSARGIRRLKVKIWPLKATRCNSTCCSCNRLFLSGWSCLSGFSSRLFLFSFFSSSRLLFQPDHPKERKEIPEHDTRGTFYFENKCFQKRNTSETLISQSWLESADVLLIK